MGKYLNATDVLIILFSAFVVIWGINAALRNVGMGEYQA